MQGSRNMDILKHICDYCDEIVHTMDTLGRNFEVFASKFNLSECSGIMRFTERRIDYSFYR